MRNVKHACCRYVCCKQRRCCPLGAIRSSPHTLTPAPLQVNLQAAVREQGFVVQESEAALLQRPAGAEAAADSPQHASPARSGSGGGVRWVSHLQALTSSIGGGVKDSIDRGRMRIAHRRAQSLGATAYEAPSP